MENYDKTVLFEMKMETSEDFMQGDLDVIVLIIKKYEIDDKKFKFIEADGPVQQTVVRTAIMDYMKDTGMPKSCTSCFMESADKIYEYVKKEFNKDEEAK